MCDIPREVYRWLQSLSLSISIRKAHRDLANGVLFSDILSRYVSDVPCHGIQHSVKSDAKMQNWAILRKQFHRVDVMIPEKWIVGTMEESEGSGLQILFALYTKFTGQPLPTNPRTTVSVLHESIEPIELTESEKLAVKMAAAASLPRLSNVPVTLLGAEEKSVVGTKNSSVTIEMQPWESRSNRPPPGRSSSTSFTQVRTLSSNTPGTESGGTKLPALSESSRARNAENASPRSSSQYTAGTQERRLSNRMPQMGLTGGHVEPICFSEVKVHTLPASGTTAHVVPGLLGSKQYYGGRPAAAGRTMDPFIQGPTTSLRTSGSSATTPGMHARVRTSHSHHGRSEQQGKTVDALLFMGQCVVEAKRRYTVDHGAGTRFQNESLQQSPRSGIESDVSIACDPESPSMSPHTGIEEEDLIERELIRGGILWSNSTHHGSIPCAAEAWKLIHMQVNVLVDLLSQDHEEITKLLLTLLMYAWGSVEQPDRAPNGHPESWSSEPDGRNDERDPSMDACAEGEAQRCLHVENIHWLVCSIGTELSRRDALVYHEYTLESVLPICYWAMETNPNPPLDLMAEVVRAFTRDTPLMLKMQLISKLREGMVNPPSGYRDVLGLSREPEPSEFNGCMRPGTKQSSGHSIPQRRHNLTQFLTFLYYFCDDLIMSQSEEMLLCLAQESCVTFLESGGTSQPLLVPFLSVVRRVLEHSPTLLPAVMKRHALCVEHVVVQFQTMVSNLSERGPSLFLSSFTIVAMTSLVKTLVLLDGELWPSLTRSTLVAVLEGLIRGVTELSAPCLQLMLLAEMADVMQCQKPTARTLETLQLEYMYSMWTLPFPFLFHGLWRERVPAVLRRLDALLENKKVDLVPSLQYITNQKRLCQEQEVSGDGCPELKYMAEQWDVSLALQVLTTAIQQDKIRFDVHSLELYKSLLICANRQGRHKELYAQWVEILLQLDKNISSTLGIRGHSAHQPEEDTKHACHAFILLLWDTYDRKMRVAPQQDGQPKEPSFLHQSDTTEMGLNTKSGINDSNIQKATDWIRILIQTNTSMHTPSTVSNMYL